MPPRKRKHQSNAANTQTPRPVDTDASTNGNPIETQTHNNTEIEPSVGGTKYHVGATPVQPINGLGNRISQATKQKIKEGQYIELVSLLPQQLTINSQLTRRGNS